MPGRKRLPGTMWVCWDSSGSCCGRHELESFRDNIVVNCSRMGIDRVLISYVDGVLNMNPATDKPWFEHRTSRGSAANKLDLVPFGGGGTSFDPIFDYVKDSGEYVKGLIYLTDGYGRVNAPKPDFPVLWATTRVAPTFVNQGQWGEIVYI